jgi:hypothetical protein
MQSLKRRGLTAAVIGAGLMLLGFLLFIAAGVTSAIHYNAQEYVEGAPTGPPPVWIQIFGWVSVSIGITGLILAVAAVAVMVLTAVRPPSGGGPTRT